MASPGAIRAGRAFIELTLDNDQFTQEWAQFRSSVNKITGVLARAGAAATVFGGAITAAFARMSLVAADAETGFRRFALIFGEDADMMREKLRAIESDTGIAMTTLIRQASAFGAVFSELGEQLGPEQFTTIVAKAQRSVVDLAGIAGISMEEASDRIKSALTSTGESVDQFGFNLRQAEINAELQRMGINKNVRQLTELEKQLVKIQLIQVAIERGQLDFANMTSTLNAKITQLRSNLEELWVNLTALVVPILKVAVAVMNTIVRVLNMMPFRWLVSILGLVVAAVGAVAFAVGGLLLVFVGLTVAIVGTITALRTFGGTVTGLIGPTGGLGVELVILSAAWTTLTGAISSATAALWSFLMAAWPIVIVIGAIAAAILGLVYAISKIASFSTGKNVGMLDVLFYPTEKLTGKGGSAGATEIVEDFAMSTLFGRLPAVFEKLERKWSGRARDRGAGGAGGAGGGVRGPIPAMAQSVIGSRLISQQLAYGTGVSTPAQESAKHLSHLSQIADKVTGGEDAIRTVPSS